MQIRVAFCACLVVVIDEIQAVDTAVCGSVTPVVNHIVDDIQIALILLRILCKTASQRPVASCAVNQQIMVEASDVAADGSCKGMGGCTGSIGIIMHGIVERFTDDIPLEGNVLCKSGAEAFIGRP